MTVTEQQDHSDFRPGWFYVRDEDSIYETYISTYTEYLRTQASTLWPNLQRVEDDQTRNMDESS